jgi:hypothetical protein
MRYDAQTVQNAERAAFAMLTRPVTQVHPSSNDPAKFQHMGEDEEGLEGRKKGRSYVPNKFYAQPAYVTGPVTLVQEMAFAAAGPYQFTFTAVQAPAPTPLLNNRVLGVNDIVCIYGIQILQGLGALAVNRIYRSYGIAANDNAIYNSTVSMRLETNTLVDGIDGQEFRDVPNSPTESWDNMGMKLVQPLRIFTGSLGTLFLTITPNNSLAALLLTGNLFLSMRLKCVLGKPNVAK